MQFLQVKSNSTDKSKIQFFPLTELNWFSFSSVQFVVNWMDGCDGVDNDAEKVIAVSGQFQVDVWYISLLYRPADHHLIFYSF